MSLSLEQIEECYPDGGSCDEFGQAIITPQWLVDYARAIERAATIAAMRRCAEMVSEREVLERAKAAAVTEDGRTAIHSVSGLMRDYYTANAEQNRMMGDEIRAEIARLEA